MELTHLADFDITHVQFLLDLSLKDLEECGLVGVRSFWDEGQLIQCPTSMLTLSGKISEQLRSLSTVAKMIEDRGCIEPKNK